MTGIEDPWWSGETYERFMGRWSRPIAAQFLDWLAVPAGRLWLDLGCGTGSLSQAILERASPQQVVAVDPATGFLDHARQLIVDPRISFKQGSASDLPVEKDSADVLVSGLVFNFIPDLRPAWLEMKRAVRPGGMIAAYVWDYAGRMEMLRHFWDAALALDPMAADMDEGRRFPLCHPEELERHFRRAGLQGVAVEPLPVSIVFRDFRDYWQPFLGGQGPAPGYVGGLSGEARRKLESGLRDRLPVQRDGSIKLMARAWAVKGMR